MLKKQAILVLHKYSSKFVDIEDIQIFVVRSELVPINYFCGETFMIIQLKFESFAFLKNVIFSTKSD